MQYDIIQLVNVAQSDRAPFSQRGWRGFESPHWEKSRFVKAAFFLPSRQQRQNMPHPPPERRKNFPLLHRSSLFTHTSAALPCGRQIRWQRVLLPYLGTASDKKTSSGAPHHLAVLLAVLFSHQTRAAVTATAMPPAIAPARGNGKNFCQPGHRAPRPSLPGKDARRQHSAARPNVSGKPRFSANARPYGLKRKAFQADNARTPVRSAGKYVPPAASGSERCYRASNALAGGQFLPRQIKGSPVQHRIRQEGSPCCWSLCGAAWRYAEKTASLPCRWRCGRKEGSAQVYRPSEAAASHGQGIIWPAQLPARQRPLYRR